MSGKKRMVAARPAVKLPSTHIPIPIAPGKEKAKTNSKHLLAALGLVCHARCHHLAAHARLCGHPPARNWLELVAQQGASGGRLHKLDALHKPASKRLRGVRKE